MSVADTANSIYYNGYTYSIGDLITLKDRKLYKDSYGPSYITVDGDYVWKISQIYPTQEVKIFVKYESGSDYYQGYSGFVYPSQIASGGTPDKYTYSFNANGGSGAPSAMTKTYGVHFTFPSTKPTRTGYTFNGWYNSGVNNGTVYAAGTQYIGLPDQNITWYASWTANNYKITYNPNGGSGSSQTQTVTYGSSWQSKGAIFSKTGYTQISWNTKADGTGVTYSLSKTQTNAQLSNLTLYAIWKANTYTVYFNAGGGSVSPTSKTVTYGLTYGTLPTPSRSGYTFNGWYTASSGGTKVTSNSTVSATSDLTLYAQWTINTYALTVNPNGGEWNGKTSKQTFVQNYGSSKSISNPTRTGYSFAGWKLNGYGSFSGQTYTYGAGNGELVAQWNRIILTVTFDASTNGGSPNSTKDVYYGDAIGSLPVPTRPYYKFDGWYTSVSGGTKVSASQIIVEDTTYYAQFKIDASVKVFHETKKYPAIVWMKVDNSWRRCLTWVKQNDKWSKSTGA